MKQQVNAEEQNRKGQESQGQAERLKHIQSYTHVLIIELNNNNNKRRLVTLAEHTSDHGRQTNSSTEEKGEQV